MTRRVNIFCSFFLLLILFSCSRGGSGDTNSGGGDGIGHDPTVSDTTAPVLQIYTPVENQVFVNGNTINITGKITDDLGLYQGVIRITDDANGSILKEQRYEIHYVLAYNFNISYTTFNVSSPADYTVTVSFEDHGLNFA